MELLIQVEHALEITGRGLALLPDLPMPFKTSVREHDVLIERPDGTTSSTRAVLSVDHFRPGGYKLIVYLPELGKASVPAGSKVWLVDEVAS